MPEDNSFFLNSRTLLTTLRTSKAMTLKHLLDSDSNILYFGSQIGRNEVRCTSDATLPGVTVRVFNSGENNCQTL
jgi:hypothetical protein